MRRTVVTCIVVITILVALGSVVAGTLGPWPAPATTNFISSTTYTRIVQNASKRNYGGATVLGVNREAGAGSTQSALIEWDLSAIAPGTKVNSASVTLTVTDSSAQTA